MSTSIASHLCLVQLAVVGSVLVTILVYLLRWLLCKAQNDPTLVRPKRLIIILDKDRKGSFHLRILPLSRPVLPFLFYC